ncbi:NAD(P)H-hydrate epimerase [Alkalispirillum mobile]|uniref:Bifunctional NAD(P)H-hydrate repair enzyme n=1 Tax=Alkalispirillum mobile TaxID=85925 RepID=A0A498C7T8_9GAMM|nr:NAD(P)H-hydrate dehydratase [Alkalispirillum mobile]RLK51187.1 NAD(P)H-hydrate epimerase [Alkalispirillum mobile]
MERLPEYLYTPVQVQELDRRAIQDHGLPGLSLMERAGRRGWEVLLNHWPHVRRLRVLCGGGNNGGDGYVVARLARRAGLTVTVQALSDPDKLQGDAATVAKRYREEGGRIEAWNPAGLADEDVVVDALLGTGLDRPVEGRYLEALRAVKAAEVPVLAIDVPSGLNAATGAVMGEAVEAACTVTFIGLKPGLLTGAGPHCAGQLHFDDLGVPAEIYQGMKPVAALCREALRLQRLAPRQAHAHKGNFGHALVIGGDLGMGGAVRMAGEAAGRAGAGLVSLATRPAHVSAILAARPEIMAHGLEGPEGLVALLDRATAWALGPGLGQDPWGQALWDVAMQTDHPCVLDADALNLLARAPRPCPNAVLTPHPGEAARLLGVSTAEVQADRLDAARRLVERYQAVVVLKGAGSVIAAPDGGLRLATAGNPGMASGGMGDVLTGVVLGLLAQGIAPAEAAEIGVLVHARAADRAAEAGQRGLLAGDVLDALRAEVNP